MKRLLFLLICAHNFIAATFDNNIVIVSIPKCGTHLLGKTLKLITGKPFAYSSGIMGTMKEEDLKLKGKILLSHCNYARHNIDLFNRYKNCKYFFIYRDPRDAVVSMISHLNECIERSKKSPSGNQMPNFCNTDEMIHFIISEYGRLFNADLTDLYLVSDYYGNFLNWFKDNKFCLIKYENLIGEDGLGDSDLQFNEIAKIYKHLGLKYCHDDVKNVASNLFGGTHSFREGSIGKWKSYFNKANRQFMGSIMGQVIIDLGYEKDLKWAE